MRKSLKRLCAMFLCVSMFSTVVFADAAFTPDVLDLNTVVRGPIDEDYEVTYTTELWMNEDIAKIAALNYQDSEFLKGLLFTCVLEDELVKQLEGVDWSDFKLTGKGSANYSAVEAKKSEGAVELTYQLNPDVVDEWFYMSLAEVKEALMQPMVMTSVKTAPASVIEAAKDREGQIITSGSIVVTYGDGDDPIPYFNLTEIVVAEGTSTLKFNEAPVLMNVDVQEENGSYNVSGELISLSDDALVYFASYDQYGKMLAVNIQGIAATATDRDLAGALPVNDDAYKIRVFALENGTWKPCGEEREIFL